MTVRHEPWPPGTPAWVDLGVPDLTTARDFYGKLFGWEFLIGPPETGYYSSCVKDGEQVAAIGGQMPGDEAPPSWTVYLATDDAAAAAGAVEAAGGRVIVAPMPVMEFGTMAIFADPAGAVAGLWQSGTHTGANRVDESGSVVWTEQLSYDLPASQAFYSSVFGYSYPGTGGEGRRYVSFQLNGVTRGGLGVLGGEAGPEVPPHWLVYFGVADADAAAAFVAANGGVVVRPPRDTEHGRLAILEGPFAEVFAVLQD